ncbi:MAG TPA: WD40 repeat domain-containing protein [Fimbriiglobus sp.]|nr:WD40 repeat domain-containing protein [Fimbriiglobus sp.]
MTDAQPIRRFLASVAFAFGACSLLVVQAADPFRPSMTLKGHTDPIYSVAVAPGGRFVATGSFDRTVKLWDLATGAEARSLGGKNGHQNQVLSLAFSPAGDVLASGGSDNVVKLWSLPSAKPAASLAGPSAVTRVAVAPDGRTAAIASADGAIKLWSPADGKAGPTLTGHTGAVTGVAFVANGQTLVSVGEDRTLRYWSATKGEPLAVVGAAVAEITGLGVSQNAVVTASADGMLQFWPPQPTAGKPCLPAKQVSDPAAVGVALAVTANGSHVLTAGKAKGVAVWNAGSGAKERTLEATAPVVAVAVSKNNQFAAVAHGADRQVTLFNLGNGSVVGGFKSPAVVRELAFHPSNAVLSAALADKRAVSWGVAFEPGQPLPPEFGKPVQDFPHPAAVRSVAYSGDGLLLTAADDKQARAWKPASDQPTKTLQHPNLVDSVAFDKSGKRLATGCHDGILRIWDVAKGQATKTINAHTQPQPSAIYVVAWSPDGEQLVTGSYDRSIKFWDAGSGKLVREIKPGSERLPPDPTLVAAAPALVGGPAGSVLGASPRPGHIDQVFALAFTPDGRYLASGSSDRTVKLWDAKTGRHVRDFPNPSLSPPGPGLPPPSHPGFVHCVRFTPDGSRLVSAGTAPRNQGYLAVWSVADGKLLAGQELLVGSIYSFDLTADGKFIVLGCGPKERGHTESEAVVVPLPGG